MNVTTKQEVVQYIISRTREIQMNSDLEPLTTNAVADAVKISRNLASFYLNELEKEKILLKEGGRPVYFLYKKDVPPTSSTPFFILFNPYSTVSYFSSKVSTFPSKFSPL